MSVLKNPRHELYAQALAQGKTASEAIGLAGYHPDPRNTTRLTNHTEIRRRVNELLNMKAAREQRQSDYDSRWVIEELIDNAIKAKTKGDFSASNNALKLLGIEKHMFRERIETGNVGDFENIENVPDLIEQVTILIGPEKAQQFAELLGINQSNSPDIEQAKQLLEAETPTDTVN